MRLLHQRKNECHGLIAPEQMAKVDQLTIDTGTPGIVLMERAGTAVTRTLRSRWTSRPVHVLAGPGNNGGDGWVVARQLHQLGWPVTVYSNWRHEKLKGDAALACQSALSAGVPVHRLAEVMRTEGGVIVDALFGAGLSKPVTGNVATVLATLSQQGRDSLAVDLPSGVDGRTGEVLGQTLPAQSTVTFHRLKPGHLLRPGRDLCGEIYLKDIGLIEGEGDACAFHNHPGLWSDELPYPPTAAHKYARGGVLVLGGGRHQTGAARLAAKAAAHAGAGAVTIATRPSAINMYTQHLTAIMVQAYDDVDALRVLARSSKIKTIIAGPGMGVEPDKLNRLKILMAVGKPMVLDADALTLLSQEKNPGAEIPKGSVLTPHEGEFARLFPDLKGDAMTRAQAAADRCGQVVLLKGATTVIAAPGQVPILNTHASSYLATAGAGDVLTGIIAAMLAQGVTPQLIAAAGAWLHGDAARRFGPGLTADDLPNMIPQTIRALSDL